MDYQTKQEMNALSKEVFGSSSRWQKLVNKGFAELVTEEVEETIPADENGENGGVEVVRKPVLRSDGAKQSVMTRHTVESVKELMLKMKSARDQYLARLKTSQEEARKAQEAQAAAQAVHKELAGSASL